ncbi:MAG: hypothetical protein MZV64_63030 [Ignavibacteriales bacterium]|nr:hypothetical protein [Ignavibacteriales bacterium]
MCGLPWAGTSLGAVRSFLTAGPILRRRRRSPDSGMKSDPGRPDPKWPVSRWKSPRRGPSPSSSSSTTTSPTSKSSSGPSGTSTRSTRRPAASKPST